MELDEPYDFQTWHNNVPVVKEEKKEKKIKKEAAKAEKRYKKESQKKDKEKMGKRKERGDKRADAENDEESGESSSSDSDIDSDSDDSSTMPKPKKKKSRKSKKNKKTSGQEACSDDEAQAPENEDQPESKKKKENKDGPGRKGEFGIWIGNLSFLTTDKALRHFFKDVGADITRVNLPTGRDKRNKGFAYIDFSSQQGQESAIALSEKELDGRKVLIKSSKSFAGRPMVSKTEVTDKSFKQKHTESPTLFVGNLSFNTTRESLKALFEDAGEIRKVRLATFEDTGKCKGFAYIDYTEAEAATKALRDPKKHYLDGRRLKVEYASADATLRGNPRLYRKHLREQEAPADGNEAATSAEGNRAGAEEDSTRKRSATSNPDEQRAKRQRRPRGEAAPKKLQGHQRPGFALAMAQRASQGIQEFKGTKMTFGDD